MADVEVDRLFTCRECGKSYNKKWRLEEHRRSHTGERPYICRYEGCNKSFIRPFHLKRHLLNHTGQKASFRCSFPGCIQTFSHKHNLKRHEQRSHNHPFKCEYEGCNKSFKKSIQLRRHTCLHTNESLFKCQVEGCGRGFDTSSRLLRHAKVHNKGYICSVPGCSEAFNKFSQLAVHIRTHGFVCEECKKTFKTVWELKKHAQIHSSNRKMYECPREGCSRVYTKAFNLRVHIKAFHDGHRPYLCTVEGCGKGFSHKVSLRQHLVLHSQNKIKPKPPPAEKKKSKKKKKPLSLAKRLSGYRSSPSESSDTHTETASKKRKVPGQLQRKVSENAKVKTVNTGGAHGGEGRQSIDCTSTSTMDVAESANARSSNERSGTTIASKGRSEKMQTCVTSEALSNVMLSNESPVTNSSFADGSEKSRGCCFFASTDTNIKHSKGGQVWCPMSTSNSYRNKPEGMLGSTASGARTNLTSSLNVSVVSAADKNNSERSQIGVSSASSASNIHAFSECCRSSTVTVNINKPPVASTSRQQNTKTVVEDHMFFSSDEEIEDMDCEPIDDTCVVGSGREHEFEGVQNDSSISLSTNEVGSEDKHLAVSGADSSRKVLSEEVSFEQPTAVNSKDSTEVSVSCQHSNSVCSLPGTSNQMDITPGGNVKRSQTNKKKKKKRAKKTRGALNVEESSSISIERVSTDRPNSLVTRLNASCSSDGGDKEVNAFKNADFPSMDDVLEVIIEEEDEELNSISIESVSVERRDSQATRLNTSCNSDSGYNEVNLSKNTHFPGMDDMLQVIIDEEDEDRAKSQCETSLDDMSMEEGYVDVSSSGMGQTNCIDRGSSEKYFTNSKEHVISSEKHVMISEKHVISSSGRELTIEETQEGSDGLRLGRNTRGNFSDSIGICATEQGDVEDERFKDTSNGYDDVGSDERVANVSDQHVDSAPVIQTVHDKKARKESFSNSLTRDNQKAGHSRALTCDRVHVARDRSGYKAETWLDLPRAQDSEEISKRDSEGDVSTNAEGERTVPQPTDERSNHKKERNFSAKPALDKRTSRMPAKSARPNTSKARVKNSKPANSSENGNLDGNGLDLESKKRPRSSTTPKKNCEAAEPCEDVSKVKFRSKNNIFTCDLQTLELLWNFKGK